MLHPPLVQVDMPAVKAVKERVDAAKALSANMRQALALRADQKAPLAALKALLAQVLQQKVQLPEQAELQVRAAGCWPPCSAGLPGRGAPAATARTPATHPTPCLP
jgi:hypothetical protein